MTTSRRERARRWGAALASAGILGVGGLEVAGCEESYDPPCKVARTKVLVTDPALNARPSLVRARLQAMASWMRREILDAGVADGAPASPLRASIAGFEVVGIDEAGSLLTRTSVPAPEALRLRTGGIGTAGVVAEDGAFLVYWVETSVTSEPDGRVRTDAAVKLARVRNGVAAPPEAPASVSCQRCTLTLAPVGLGDRSVLFARIDPDPEDLPVLGAASPARFVALRAQQEGGVIDEPIPWLVPPPSRNDASAGGDDGRGIAAGSAPDTPLALSASVDAAGRVVVTAGGFAWLVDSELHLLAGPLVLPAAADALVRWEVGVPGQASVAWSISPFADGRATSDVVQREVFLGAVPAGAAAAATRERIDRGRAVLALDRRGEEVGVLFESAARTLFAAADPAGRKRGGDVMVRGRSGSASEFGTIELTATSLLFARGEGRFTAVTMGSGELVTTEIVCAR